MPRNLLVILLLVGWTFCQVVQPLAQLALTDDDVEPQTVSHQYQVEASPDWGWDFLQAAVFGPGEILLAIDLVPDFTPSFAAALVFIVLCLPLAHRRVTHQRVPWRRRRAYSPLPRLLRPSPQAPPR